MGAGTSPTPPPCPAPSVPVHSGRHCFGRFERGLPQLGLNRVATRKHRLHAGGSVPARSGCGGCGAGRVEEITLRRKANRLVAEIGGNLLGLLDPEDYGKSGAGGVSPFHRPFIASGSATSRRRTCAGSAHRSQRRGPGARMCFHRRPIGPEWAGLHPKSPQRQSTKQKAGLIGIPVARAPSYPLVSEASRPAQANSFSPAAARRHVW